MEEKTKAMADGINDTLEDASEFLERITGTSLALSGVMASFITNVMIEPAVGLRTAIRRSRLEYLDEIISRGVTPDVALEFIENTDGKSSSHLSSLLAGAGAVFQQNPGMLDLLTKSISDICGVSSSVTFGVGPDAIDPDAIDAEFGGIASAPDEEAGDAEEE